MAAEQATWRTCCWPGCPDRFDIAAVMNGEARADGWLMKVLSLNFLCPVHSIAGHLPSYRLTPDRTGIPTCQCGWDAEAGAPTLGDIIRTWQTYVGQLA